MKTNLEILREARALLAEKYVKWIVDDNRGGHCAVGCISLAEFGDAYVYDDEDEVIHLTDQSAVRMHTELTGLKAARMTFEHFSGELFEKFDEYPTEYVNNHLGKEAILAVFDDAILHEEMREMLAQLELEEPVADVPFERELVAV